MSPEIKLLPLAYLDIVRHIKRFNHEDTPEAQRQLIYGVITGQVENGVPNITKYIPMTHTNAPLDFELNHEIFKSADKYNTEHRNPQSGGSEILGFVRSYPADTIELSNIDKKNLLYFQTGYSDAAIFIGLDYSGDQYQMQMKHFKGSLPELDETSELEDIAWNFKEIEDMDELFSAVLNIHINRLKKAPLIKESNEK